MTDDLKQFVIELDVPPDTNIIFGQAHFIKTVEDLFEAVVNSVPSAKFGLAFCEASGPCLVRFTGNDEPLTKVATNALEKIGAGHTFLIVMEGCFPINILPAVKACREVVNIFCATANPVQVIIAETAQGRGVLGVIDGFSPKGVETESDQKERHSFLRKIGYKK